MGFLADTAGMSDALLPMLVRLQRRAAKFGQRIDPARFAADADYAKTAILRFADFGDEAAVVQALRALDRLGAIAAADAAPRGPVLRRELRPAAGRPMLR